MKKTDAWLAVVALLTALAIFGWAFVTGPTAKQTSEPDICPSKTAQIRDLEKLVDALSAEKYGLRLKVAALELEAEKRNGTASAPFVSPNPRSIEARKPSHTKRISVNVRTTSKPSCPACKKPTPRAPTHQDGLVPKFW